MTPQTLPAFPSDLNRLDADTIRRHADEILIRYESWLQKAARSIAGSSSPHLEDLVQEGRLALWHALSTYDPDRGKLPSWLVYKARYRMYEVLQGKPWTGQPPRFHGKQGIQEPAHVVSLDASPRQTADGGAQEPLSATVPPPRDTPDDTESAELAYHDDELCAALARLTPQQQRYVTARFWEGMTTAEMKAEVFGYDPSALWNAKGNGAKRKLRESLAHLEDATS